MTVEEQRLLFQRLSPESFRTFREKQFSLFSGLLTCFGVPASRENVQLFTNISLTAMVVCRAIPGTLPLFVPEAADGALAVQIDAIAAWLESLRE